MLGRVGRDLGVLCVSVGRVLGNVDLRGLLGEVMCPIVVLCVCVCVCVCVSVFFILVLSRFESRSDGTKQ